MKPPRPAQTDTCRSWMDGLNAGLDRLEQALLAGDAPGAESASAAISEALQNAPQRAAARPGDTQLRQDIARAARRFALLRQALARSMAQSQRALQSFIPPGAEAPPPTYGRSAGFHRGGGGPGQAFLSA